MRRQIIAPVVAGVLLALATTAQADQKTTSFQVSANVKKNCLVSAAAMAFGDWTVEADTTTSSTITVRCTSGTTYTVNLDSGVHGTAVDNRQMDGPGSANVKYFLYTTDNIVWGDGTNGTDNDGGTGAGLGSPQGLTVNGKIFAADNEGAIYPGLYTDTVTATIVY